MPSRSASTALARQAAISAAGLLTFSTVLVSLITHAVGATSDAVADALGKIDGAAGITKTIADNREMGLGSSIVVLLFGALLLFNTLILGFIETWKAMGTDALHESPDTLSEEGAAKARRVRGLVIFAMLSQTFGVVVGNIVAYVVHRPFGRMFLSAVNDKELTRVDTKRSLRWYLALTAVALGFAAAALMWAAEEMRTMP